MASARIMAGPNGRAHAISRAPVEIETPAVMVAGDDDSAVMRIRRVLMDTGYQVTPRRAGPHMMEDLRQRADCALRQCPVELLVLEGVERPWVALALIEVAREAYASLPIILCTERDPEVHRETKRLAVDVVFDRLPDDEELRRTALDLAPIMPEAGDGLLN